MPTPNTIVSLPCPRWTSLTQPPHHLSELDRTTTKREPLIWLPRHPYPHHRRYALTAVRSILWPTGTNCAFRKSNASAQLIGFSSKETISNAPCDAFRHCPRPENRPYSNHWR